MSVLTQKEEIQELIQQLTTAKILWLDTEIAHWDTPYPKLSLIQVLFENQAYILDVLDKPDLIEKFVNKIMQNSLIEKVFHNAVFDLRYLGGKELAQNVTCTYEISKKIPLEVLETSNRKLKTLAAQMCNFTNVDLEEQSSDWSRRPLSEKQLEYAKMDVVYLKAVYHRLLELNMAKKNSFTVTDVRVAFECPRLFYLSKKDGGKTLFIPADNVKGIGTAFHKLANDLLIFLQTENQLNSLFTEQSLDADNITLAITSLVYEKVFFPQFIEPEINKNSPNVDHLQKIWQGANQLVNHWVKLLIKNYPHTNINQLITDTLIAGEIKLEHNFILPNGSEQLLTGKLDSLVQDLAKKRLCVVEYKTYQPADKSAQLAQVAIYSYMLAKQKNVPVDAAVYCVLPEFKEYYYTWEELEQTVHEIIPYKLQQMGEWVNWKQGQPDAPPPTISAHLCDICPQQEKCQTLFNSAQIFSFPPFQRGVRGDSLQGNNPPQPPLGKGGSEGNNPPQPILGKGGSEGNNPPFQREVRGDELAQNLVNVLQSFKVDVEYLGAIIAPSFIRVKLKPNLGVKTASIVKLSEDLQVQLGIAAPPLISPQPGYVSVDLPREKREVAYFESYIFSGNKLNNAPVKIAIGVDLEGKLIEAELSDPNTCHFLVGGTTGSGKSEFLRSLLLSLIYRYSPQQLKIALVDPKRVTFPEFEKMPWLLAPVVKDSEAAIELMEELVTEMERRYQIFEIAKCADIDSYNEQKTEKKLSHFVCIFDEYADFMAEKESRNILEQSIKRLGAMARAAGIHLIISTQRPEARVVTPLIRSNLPGRIALRTASEADSEIILGGKQNSAAYLLGKGDLLYQVGSNLQRLQSLFTPQIKLPPL